MADSPVFHSAIDPPLAEFASVQLIDESHRSKWRIWDDVHAVEIGRGRRVGEGLVFSVSPGEWMVIGERPPEVEAVDITHVRSALRLAGDGARPVLEHLCALDLSDAMSPNHAAARSLVAGIATEIVRDDVEGVPSYLLLMSRSFARSLYERLVAVADGLP